MLWALLWAGAAVGCKEGALAGHHDRDTVCGLGTGTADESDGSLLLVLCSHSLAAPGPRVALPLPIVPSWGRAGCQCFPAVAESVTHPGWLQELCLQMHSRSGHRGTPVFAGGWIAAFLCLLNTGMHRMGEGIALLLIQSRGLLLGLLPVRRWLLSLGCSVFLSRAASGIALLFYWYVRELVFLHWWWASYVFHVSYSKGQQFLLLPTFIDVIYLSATHKVFFSDKVLQRKLRYTFTDIFSNYIPLWMFLMLWIAYPALTWSKQSETRAFFPGELAVCTTCNSFKICAFPVQWLKWKIHYRHSSAPCIRCIIVHN